jgi:RNA polymerase sigma factor (sigma-70 family)
MDAEHTGFDHLERQARAGNEDAVRRLCEEYSEKLRCIIRRRLDPKLRRQFESDDFLQSVWGSFFTQPNEPGPFQSPRELERYLCAMARNKVIDAGRQLLHTQKHAAVEQNSWTLEADRTAFSREPTPSQAVMADERWEKMRASLPPIQREMLDLLREGHSHREIAQRYDMHPKVVQRLLQCLLEGFEW